MKGDTMLLAYGAVFILVAVVVTALLLAYFYLREKEEPAKDKLENKKPAMKKPSGKPKTPSVIQLAKEEPRNVSPIPPDVPRTLGTIKIIAEEKPDWMLKIVRRWLKQK